LKRRDFFESAFILSKLSMLVLEASLHGERSSAAVGAKANYFSVGTTSKAYRALDNYTAVRLRWAEYRSAPAFETEPPFSDRRPGREADSRRT
jgi:hypothetical protein